MAISITFEQYAKISTVLRHSEPMVTSNKSRFVSNHFPGNMRYALMAFNPLKGSLEGSVSWQSSGFDFEIEIENKRGQAMKVVYGIYGHSNFLASWNSKADSIIDSFTVVAINKANALLAPPQNTQAPNLSGYYFKKKKSKASLTPKFTSNLKDMLQTGLITKEFYNFAKNYGGSLTLTKYR